MLLVMMNMEVAIDVINETIFTCACGRKYLKYIVEMRALGRNSVNGAYAQGKL